MAKTLTIRNVSDETNHALSVIKGREYRCNTDSKACVAAINKYPHHVEIIQRLTEALEEKTKHLIEIADLLKRKTEVDRGLKIFLDDHHPTQVSDKPFRMPS